MTGDILSWSTFKNSKGALEMAQPSALATTLDSLSLILETHIVERENRRSQVSTCASHIHTQK